MKLPPYGRAVEANRPPEVSIFAGADAWDRNDFAKQHDEVWQDRIVLPPECRPRQFRWPVRGIDCLVATDSRHRADEVAWICLHSGAPVVRAIINGILVVYR